MADNESSSPGAGGLSPAKRKRIEQCYQHAIRTISRDEYDFDYAHGLLSQCIQGEPGNPDYIEAFLKNLYKKHNNAGKVGKLVVLSGAGARSSMKKSLGQKDWTALAKQGTDLLKNNPWDSTALMYMAAMCEGLGQGRGELSWLKSALRAAPNDAEVNRQCALALARRHEWDQAIACWHRVEKAKPGDEEASKEISLLALQKTRSQSGVDEDKKFKPKRSSVAEGTGADEDSPESRLKQMIAEEPKVLNHYFELSQLYISTERFKEAEAILAKAVEVSNNDPDVRERWEDAQLRRLRQKIGKAEAVARSTRTPEAIQQYKRLRRDLALRELEVYKNRCERYPNNLTFKYDLGLRYQMTGQYGEAIKQYQMAQNDPRRKGLCLLSMGQCFEQIKQLRLAMTNYSQAVEEIPDRDVDNRKRALYQAGRLSLELNDGETASKYLTPLAQLDFGYKDVAALLDKIEKMGQDNGSDAPPET